jgi:hypothetical protein
MQRRAILPLSFAILSSALLLAHTARGAEGVSVTITNDSTEDILADAAVGDADSVSVHVDSECST